MFIAKPLIWEGDVKHTLIYFGHIQLYLNTYCFISIDTETPASPSDGHNEFALFPSRPGNKFQYGYKHKRPYAEPTYRKQKETCQNTLTMSTQLFLNRLRIKFQTRLFIWWLCWDLVNIKMEIGKYQCNPGNKWVNKHPDFFCLCFCKWRYYPSFS